MTDPDRPTDEVGRRRDKDALILAALLAGYTYEQAAQVVGVSERTVRRRLEDPDFRERLTAAHQDAFDRVTAALTAGCVGWVRTLSRVADDRDASTSSQVAAARAGLAEARAYNAAAVLEARLAVLEAAMGGTA